MSTPIHIEICIKNSSSATKLEVKEYVSRFVSRTRLELQNGFLSFKTFNDEPYLAENVYCITCDVGDSLQLPGFQPKTLLEKKWTPCFHLYRLNGSEREGYDIGAQEDETISTASQWTLPCREFHGLWENLVYDSNLKDQLLSYANTALMFSDRQVNSHIVSCNRVVLLHGPPGTGKTSLCRALAQKLAIRLGDRYLQTLLIEINSHSLFSKWFSESGKLVHRMFEDIRAKTRNPELLICVLIDEVESLTAARSAAIKGTDPSDAIRVVNAFLTQIDRIKKHSNVLILTTSNVTGAIDVAFVDRADIKHYIGVPSAAAAYSIYRSCFQELARVGIIKTGEKLLDLRALDILRMAENPITRLSLRLLDIARQSNGFSGRTLRKLPFLAYALYFKGGNVTAEMFLDMLEAVVQKQHKDRENMDVEQ